MAATKDAGFPVTAVDLTPNAHGLTWPAFTTPGSNRMVTAMYIANGSTANAISTMTSPNLTWTMQVRIVDAGNNNRVEIWTAFAASVVTGEVITTVDTASASLNRRSQVITSVQGSDSSGVGNVASDPALTTIGTLAVTATGAGSYLIAGFPYRSSGSDCSVDANTTSEFDAGGGGGFGFNERSGSRLSSGAGALTLAWSGGSTPFSVNVIAGLEIKQAGGGGSSPTYVQLERKIRGLARGLAEGLARTCMPMLRAA